MCAIQNSLPIQERQEQCTRYETLLLTECPVFEFNPTPIHSLWSLLHKISDPRRAQGRRHSIPVLLMLALLAMCCGYSNYEAMQDWARNYQDKLKKELPFLAGHMPSASTFHRVFTEIDARAVEKICGEWIQAVVSLEKGEGIALDGKTVGNTDIHLLSAFAHRAKAVLFQRATTTKGKELVIGPQVLRQISLKGHIVTGDAMFAQVKICRLITKKGGGFVFTVKDNQRTLAQDIQIFFAEPPHNAAIDTHTTQERQKGRDETRTVYATTELTEYIQWPGVTHVWKVVREREMKGKKTKEVAYGIARLMQTDNPAKELNKLIRGHWLIENNLHRQRDVQFNEDKSAIRKKNGPQVMSILGNLITSVFNQGQVQSFPKAFRRFAARPQELFAFMGLYRPVYAVC
jgi:predicted transposase YbfD/YdcC